MRRLSVLAVLAQCVLLWSGAADANAVDEALARLEAARARIITPSDSAPVHYSSMPVAQPMTQPVTLGLMPNASTTVAVAKPSATLPAVPPGGESFGACTTKSVRARLCGRCWQPQHVHWVSTSGGVGRVRHRSVLVIA